MHVEKVLYDLDQATSGCKVRRAQKQRNQLRDAAILAMVENYPNVEDKREYLEKVARLTATTMKP